MGEGRTRRGREKGGQLNRDTGVTTGETVVLDGDRGSTGAVRGAVEPCREGASLSGLFSGVRVHAVSGSVRRPRCRPESRQLTDQEEAGLHTSGRG